MNDEASSFRTVCLVGDIPDGEAHMAAVEDMMIAVFKVSCRYFALANECPHAGASLAHGFVEDDTVRCRIHHWRFSVRDGTCLEGNKAECNATTYPVRVVGEEIQVAVKCG